MPAPVVRSPEAYRAISLSADGVVKDGPGYAYGVYVTASSSGVIRFYDNASAASGTVILDQVSVSAQDFIPMPVEYVNGLYFDLVSGSATVTIYYI